MTPQPRHVEAAEKIADDLFYRNHASWADRRVLIESIAIALAEAENRAAWDGYDFGVVTRKGCDMFDECESKYGPRPSRGEVGNE